MGIYVSQFWGGYKINTPLFLAKLNLFKCFFSIIFANKLCLHDLTNL